MLLAICAVLLVPRAAPPGPLWVEHVGPYRIEKWVNDSRDYVESLYLKDSKARVVTWIRDYHVGWLNGLFDPAKPVIVDLNRDGVPEVVFESWNGGAHGSNRYFIWSLGKRPKCLLAYDKGNVSDTDDFRFVDFDHDGIPEIRSWYDGFAFTVGNGFYNRIPIVLKLRGGRYIDVTRSYRSLLLSSQAKEWPLIAKPPEQPYDWSSWTGPREPAVYALAFGHMMGTARQTLTRLRGLLREDGYRWMVQNNGAIKVIALGRHRRYRYVEPYAPGPVRFVPFPRDGQFPALHR